MEYLGDERSCIEAAYRESRDTGAGVRTILEMWFNDGLHSFSFTTEEIVRVIENKVETDAMFGMDGSNYYDYPNQDAPVSER